ncbi:M20 metallopeptidase family protein [Aneurinibacillus aneurinilyticus]|uniref:Amidohydrolase n=2 Tax=Aneurinibacillus aneurinilyticus TaxID=1391 RepID=A0A848CTL5_ANEAE|nr:amidohydrolase [Aneurinibacillus aneurinilyticus]ERI10138.1 amidohydrolase [Aneurinibacillus aneurinilyticus ATCC 12856]MED0705215.1 amidohydrolase [Aneurinibacillus aneurinilyticus]MED0723024.1 amidohydrolase [Aneurinibacillus aneurinilyticus]MED0733541.1 amidohydrolase [Aneurinibacillus aneurinilyticus]MED0740046.1 amidohydrolase [Aneurinibacillus aneurinilyticus]
MDSKLVNHAHNHADKQARINPLVDEYTGWIVEARRHLHQNPELSHHEMKTVGYIREQLENMGLATRSYTGKDVVAYIEGTEAGKTVALRADIDALPIQEETELPFASQNPGVMHACGHDGHTAILLGAARALVSANMPFSGKIKLIFQHAEEVVPGGANELVEAGALDDVDAIFGLHLWQNVDSGLLETCAGPIMAGSDSFTIKIQGRGGHGSMPHLTIDPIVIASHLVTQLQTVVSRSLNPLYPAVISVGQIYSGDTYNIIPDTAQLQGTVRYFHPDVQDEVPPLIERLANGVCASFGAVSTFEYVKGDPSVVNDSRMNSIVEQVGCKVLGKENVRPAVPSMAGEDFSYYLQRVPGAYFFLGIRNEQAIYSHHHPRFTIDEKMLPVGSKLLAGIALEYLEQQR